MLILTASGVGCLVFTLHYPYYSGQQLACTYFLKAIYCSLAVFFPFSINLKLLLKHYIYPFTQFIFSRVQYDCLDELDCVEHNYITIYCNISPTSSSFFYSCNSSIKTLTFKFTLSHNMIFCMEWTVLCTYDYTF